MGHGSDGKSKSQNQAVGSPIMDKKREEKALGAVSQAQDDKTMDSSSAESALKSISAEETKAPV